MADLQIVEGEWYIRRDGEIAGPARPGCVEDTRFPWHMKSDGIDRVYTDDGAWFDDGDEHDHDLVAHLPRTDPRHPEHCGANPLQIDISTIASEPGQQSATIDIEPDPRLSAGNWWVDYDHERFRYFDGVNGLMREYTNFDYRLEFDCVSYKNPAVKHLPNCTGFDWTEPELIDVGEGWRLLRDDEIVAVGDECHWAEREDTWDPVRDSAGHAAGDNKALAYRRRTEPAKPHRETIDLREYLCVSESGNQWTHFKGVGEDPPQHGRGVIVGEQRVGDVRRVEVEWLND